MTTPQEPTTVEDTPTVQRHANRTPDRERESLLGREARAGQEVAVADAGREIMRNVVGGGGSGQGFGLVGGCNGSCLTIHLRLQVRKALRDLDPKQRARGMADHRPTGGNA